MVERLSREVIIIKTFLVFSNEYNLYLEFLVIICLNNRLTKRNITKVKFYAMSKNKNN